MKKITGKKTMVWFILLVMILVYEQPEMQAKAEGIQERGNWEKVKDDWFYLDGNGIMKSGWIWSGGYWYFLNPGKTDNYGKMLTGWQWIDGRCYYLADKSGMNHPEGAMYANTITPDRYQVNSSGAWTDNDGKVQYTDGKGIQTATTTIRSVSKFFGGSSGGGGGSGRHRSSTKAGNNRGESSKNQESESGNTTGDVSTPSNAQPAKGDKGEIEKKMYNYTVKYLDIADKTVLHIVSGIGQDGETVDVSQLDIEGYEFCKGQMEFCLENDHMVIKIYYKNDSLASPSEASPSEATPSEGTPSKARKVNWKVYFVEEGNHSNQILKPQHGKTEEGSDLVIDFPETILGTDGYYYHSILPSPWSEEVSGTGTRKYYIEFEKGDKILDEDDPDQEARDKLDKWLDTARESDFKITEEEPNNQQIITKNLEESNERLLNLVSMANGTKRQEVYLIAKGYKPNTVVIGQTFDDVTNVSDLVMDEFEIEGETYTVMRIGFEKTYDEETCNHDYEVIERVEPTSTEDGYEIVRCKNCGKEETIILPATGQVSDTHYNIGDVQARTIGNKTYLFRCIDDDYEEAMNNSQQKALFLCDSVIRSDINGTSKKLTFGSNNNYKYSNIRKWIQDNATDNLFAKNTYIGITSSYLGATKKGTYEQLNDGSLMGYNRLYQSMEDKVFCLSVEEALKYREYLWRFEGSETDNPESQVSAYSKGYYLRTPQDGGIDDFRYGNGIYAVSLVDGNIQPVGVSETSIGIRPAMTIPQG